MAMKVYLGADHRGFKLKEILKSFLIEKNYEVEDLGAPQETPYDDYVDYAKLVSEKVIVGGMGILICGSGAGVNIAANKIKGIRATIGFENNQVKAARNDDDVNILCLASDFLSEDHAKELALTFLQENFNPTENHKRRIEKINLLEA